ncbi:hypothetical protein OC25_08795 [Pedobacter kyungheensis]|uniref:DUF1569 domain-containing protein n=1 Tax=Pedobacter kyungheensis TaxID=1069985 RepID=A0A0C1DB86_9SPHI|nr:DUF1569 domain-containing protein [Pedobacter kyungheensis]KIA94751.1 hypothetical protein OC25_08795 [Pedobacter kyungheensis]
MKSIFDSETRDDVIKRIDALNANSSPLWGKMTVAQMMLHCSLTDDYYLGNTKVNRSFLGRIFGKIAINKILKDNSAILSKNAPTSPFFKVTGDIKDVEAEKQKWKSTVEKYATFHNEAFVHFFFGKMTKAQLGQFIYKHTDHHLRQFGN